MTAFVGWRSVFATLAALTVVTGLGLAFARGHNETVNAFVPATLFLAALFDFATFAILTASERVDDDRPNLILAAAFMAAGTFALVSLAVVPPLPGVPALVPAPAGFSLWIYWLGHTYVGIAALVYAQLRSIGPRHRDARFTSAVAAGALALFAAAVAAALTGSALAPLGALFAALLAGAVCAAGCVRLALLPEKNAVERAVATMLLAMTLDVGVAWVAGHRFTFGWSASRVLLLLGSALVFSAVLRRLLAEHARLRDVEQAFASASRRAARIRALWHVSSSDALNDAEHLQAVLDAGRTALRVDHPIFGMIYQIEGDEVVVNAISWSGDAEAHAAALAVFAPSVRFPIGQTAATELVSSGRTRHWNDIDPHDPPSGLIGFAQWTNVVAATFQIGRVTYILAFGTSVPLASEPFAEDDLAFVDVLASQLSHRFYEREQLARIRYQMEHDALTGLCNRTEFRKAVRERVSAGSPFAVVMLDLDGFRFINETAGHLIGDEILVEVAATLSGLREGDVVARLAGDDFGIVMNDIGKNGTLAAGLQRYAAVFDRPFHTGDREGKRFLPVAASIGAAVFPNDGKTVDDLVRCADVALDAAKQRGGGTTVLYADSMAATSNDLYRFRGELVEAFQTDAFILEYQPTFDLSTGRTVGAEALVRWDHPRRGRLQPAEFVEFAERSGLGGRLARWVLRRVCDDLGPLELPPGFRCYFNLPAHLLDDPAFLTELETQLEGVPSLARHLGVEITESEAMQNAERTVQALRNIQEIGLRVAIDDFGTGYSSMAYLKRFPIDVVKIDRSFISGLPDDEKDAALDEMFLQLTRQFGFVSLAEGIETENQAAWLRGHGCMLGQGFLMSRPLPVEAFVNHMQAEKMLDSLSIESATL